MPSSSFFIMAMGILKVFMCFTLFSSSHFFMATLANEFAVGGDKGWVIPSAKDDRHFYNDWASKNRFRINDTLKFEYKDDSVMEVKQEEYDKCRSGHPLFYDNIGPAVYRLNRTGLFYFISGISGHCQRGLKMVIKVLELETPPAQSADQTAAGNSPPAAEAGAGERLLAQLGFLFMSLLGTIFVI